MNNTTAAMALLLALCPAFSPTVHAVQVSNRAPSLLEAGYLPPPGAETAANPPALAWLDEKNATSWTVQIATDAQFTSSVVEETAWPYLLYTPTEPLQPGNYAWRYRFETAQGELSNWSAVRSFTIPTSATVFPRPSARQLETIIPPSHPRMFMRPEEVKLLRAHATADAATSQQLVAAADASLKPALMTEPPPWTTGKWNVEEWRLHMRNAGQATNRMNTLAFAWLITGRAEYGARAREYLLEFSSWDPLGPSSMKINDEVGMPVLYSMARTYDWIFPLLSTADQAAVRKAMQARGNETYERMRKKPYEQFVYNSHFGRMWHFLGEAGLAFYGEIPEAETWLNYAMTIFYGWYPWWGDADGGWAEGIAYWSSYNTRVAWWHVLMQKSLGIDGSRKPFFKGVADFPLYVVPPGNPVAGFGDFSERLGSASGTARVVGTFARLRNNPNWQWYAEQFDASGGDNSYPFQFLNAMQTPPPAKPPVNLPLLKVFRRAGIAAFNTDLVTSTSNLHLAMRSSPMGNVSHSHNDQNAIVMAAFGEPLLVKTGTRDFYGSPFCKEYYWQTQSGNGLLLDGHGQPRGQAASGGFVAQGEVPGKLAYVVGDATAAYGGRAQLYRRWTLLLPEYGAVVIDELETTAAEMSILYHARAPFVTSGTSQLQSFTVKKGKVQLHGEIHVSDARTTQTDQYPLPLHDGIKPLFKEWHYRATFSPRAGTHLEFNPQRAYVVSFLEVSNPDAGNRPGRNAVRPVKGKLQISHQSADAGRSFNLLLDPAALTVQLQP